MIRIAAVGCGRWGRKLIRVFNELPGSQVVACCNARDAQRLQRVKLSYPEVDTSLDFAGILANPRVDAVVLATPDRFHFEMGKQVLAAGKHVFIEKPLALSTDQTTELIAMAGSCGKTLMTGHVMLYHPAVQWLKNEINGGSMTPVSILATRTDSGAGREDADLLWSSVIHDISVIHYLLDAEPVEVHAIEGSLNRVGSRDILFITLSFPNRIIVQVRAGFAGPHRERSLVLRGRQKIALFDALSGSLDVFTSEHSEVSGPRGQRDDASRSNRGCRIQLDDLEPLKVQCQDFLDSITSGRIPLAGGQGVLKVIWTLDRIEKCLKRSKRPES